MTPPNLSLPTVIGHRGAAGLAPEHARPRARAAAQLGAIAASTEIFGWMSRHPESLVAQ